MRRKLAAQETQASTRQATPATTTGAACISTLYSTPAATAAAAVIVAVPADAAQLLSRNPSYRDCQHGRSKPVAAPANPMPMVIAGRGSSSSARRNWGQPKHWNCALQPTCHRRRELHNKRRRADAMSRSRLQDTHSFWSRMGWTWLVAVSLFLRPATAVMVQFDNCLPESYLSNEPTLLQWVPLYVDAKFDTDHPNHTLVVTMWGNVTGAYNNVSLPAWTSPDWTDPTKTDGKIVAEPDPDSANPKITTLHSKVDVLTYEPWSNDYNFCNDSLINATCPLGPVFNYSASDLPYNLPAVNMTNTFYSSYAFTSFTATFLIIYGDTGGTDIGCVSATITPDLGNLAWMLKFLPLIALLFVGLATVFAGVFSPWGSTDIFHWTSNYGRDADLLRLVTPGFGDCLQYIQFVALTGGLTLNYPGFYSPIVSQASWSALMFNESFVSRASGWVSVQDGVYFTNATYGLQELAQLVGMGNVEDIWAGMMVWLLVIIAAMFVLVQGGFLGQWIYRYVKRIPEEDFRAKNIPFTLGNVVRIILNYFLLPIVALSTFQLVVAGDSPAYTVALAVVTLVVIMGFSGWLLYLIVTIKPRAFLYDDLSTVLLYGPLYNTYSDEAAAYAMVPLVCTFVRGIAIGAVQPSGVAQLVLLAICEVIQILTLHAFRPFHSPTSMNAYHTLFSALRLISVLLMISFVPSLGVTDGPKGWIGYAILLIHGAVLFFGFFLNAVQTMVEVLARMLGAGGDDVRGQTRGGLSKIFGMRQLSRRMSRRGAGPSRQSQLSSSAMLDADEASKSGYVTQGGRIKSESAGSMGVLLHHHRQTSSSAIDNASLDAGMRRVDSNLGSFTPTTPREASVFSFLPSPGIQTRPTPSTLAAKQAADPYYRPPRPRRQTLEQPSPGTDKGGGPWTGGDVTQRRRSQTGGSLGDAGDAERPTSRGGVPSAYAPPVLPLRTDYATRESDFYYGVRGSRLNSDAPSRKLGTGPADPNGPMASAAGWFRGMFGGKSKEKGKGFEVVRSARMPPAMRAPGGEFAEDSAPEGIPVAMGVLRNGPIDSDDEDGGSQKPKSGRLSNPQPQEAELLNEDGSPREDPDEIEVSRVSEVPPTLPDVDAGESIRMPSRIQSKASRYTARSTSHHEPPIPEVPRRSSKRTPDHSRNSSVNPSTDPSEAGKRPISQGQGTLALLAQTSSRLPFERSASQKRLSGSSMGATEDFSQVDLHDQSGTHDDRPTSYGFVHQGNINRVDRDTDLLGSSAEVIDVRR